MKGVYVGCFSAEDIEHGLDRALVHEKQLETGLNYTNTELVKRNGLIVGLKIWVCGLEDVEL